MIKVVYAEGCSVTAGAEHADWRMTTDGLEYSETTWAAQIKRMCFPKAKYFPTARSASSNGHIRRRAIYYLNQLLKDYKGKEIVFLVQWTDIGRREVRLQKVVDTKYYTTYHDEDEKLYTTILPIDFKGANFNNKIVRQEDRTAWLKKNNIFDYFSEFNLNVTSHEANTYDTLTEIDTLRTFCKANGIIMYETHAFANLLGRWYTLKSNDKFLLDLVSRIDIKSTSYYDVDEYNKPLGLHEWTKENKLQVGPGYHPLEEPHLAWARKVIAHYNIPRVKV
jgi:hypothetical protein